MRRVARVGMAVSGGTALAARHDVDAAAFASEAAGFDVLSSPLSHTNGKLETGKPDGNRGQTGSFLILSRIHRNHSLTLIAVRPSFSTFRCKTLNIFIKVCYSLPCIFTLSLEESNLILAAPLPCLPRASRGASKGSLLPLCRFSFLTPLPP
jgi:hypothetical protein